MISSKFCDAIRPKQDPTSQDFIKTYSAHQEPSPMWEWLKISPLRLTQLLGSRRAIPSKTVFAAGIELLQSLNLAPFLYSLQEVFSRFPVFTFTSGTQICLRMLAVPAYQALVSAYDKMRMDIWKNVHTPSYPGSPDPVASNVSLKDHTELAVVAPSHKQLDQTAGSPALHAPGVRYIRVEQCHDNHSEHHKSRSVFIRQ